MLRPPVGNVTLGRLTAVKLCETRLDGVVFVVGHTQDALLCVVHVASPSEGSEESQYPQEGCSGCKIILLHAFLLLERLSLPSSMAA